MLFQSHKTLQIKELWIKRTKQTEQQKIKWNRKERRRESEWLSNQKLKSGGSKFSADY